MEKVGKMEQFDPYYKISKLVIKSLRGELNALEQEELEIWLQESDHNKELFEKITNQEFINPELVSFSENNKSSAWENIQKATSYNESSRVGFLIKRLKYAAVIAFLIISTVLLYRKDQTIKKQVQQKLVKKEILPGGNKATLTLADGTRIALDDVHMGEFARQQGAVISKTSDGQIIYYIAEGASGSSGKETFNTISTPRGGQYQLILPDGSKVWLNSMSSIKFPAIFNGKERRVELNGEAYFEISKSLEKPFIVSAGGVNVKVLGTKFNIAAYRDERQIKTTLLEGSVKIAKGNNSEILKPGMQAVCEGEKPMIVRSMDAEEAIAWKNGYFLFRDEPIQDLMLTISRWYDIDVKYEGDMEGKVFGGKFSKNSNLSELLKSLELTGTIKFKVEERRVTAMP